VTAILDAAKIGAELNTLEISLRRIESLRLGLTKVREQKPQLVDTGHGASMRFNSDGIAPLVRIPTPKAFVIAAYRREIKEAQETAFAALAALNAHIEVEL